VLGDGMAFHQMRMTAVDSQLIEQLRWSAETVCSAFHCPAWKIGVGPTPPYTKPDIANQTYYSDCLQSLIEQLELCLDEGLGLDEAIGGRMLGVEMDLSGLIRMDESAQIEALTKSVGGAIHTPNEARARLSLKPKKGGDSPYLQQQNYSLAALDERDRNGPFDKPPPPPVPQQGVPEEEPDEDLKNADGERALAALVDSYTFELELAAA
jgi:phage portal protein BeeE